ncbi:hypothetical protein [Actinomadura flavalba]|uniref:hypothetical protein n=1 Tax=Actinomadura flavalba TaxID=1120938 RepID=UPI00035DB848|nr:hypothetical protein [Actinomadura flavalba]
MNATPAYRVDTAVIDLAPIHAAEVARLHGQFPAARVWFGHHTRRWWAMDGACLVEGATPDDLMNALIAAEMRRWGR